MSKIFQKIKIKLIRSLYIRNPLNIFFGQKIYGNDSGFLSNIIGNYIIKKNHKLKFNFQNLYEKNKNLNYLNKNGFIYFDYKVKDGVIQSLCNEFESEIRDIKFPTDGRLELSSIKNEYFYEKFSSINKIFDKDIKNIIKGYYGSEFKVLNTHIYRTIKLKNLDNIEAYGSTEFWHNDGSTADSLKLFVLLSNTGDNDGPMHIISKNDTAKIVKNGFKKYREGKSNGIIESKCNVKKFTGDRGSIMIADTNRCLHRGDIPNSDNHRDMLVFYITTSNKKFIEIDPKESIKEQYYGFKRLIS